MFAQLISLAKSSLIRKGATTPEEIRAQIRQRAFSDARRSINALSRKNHVPPATVECLEGELAYFERRDTDAERAFKAALDQDPSQPEAHHGLSLILGERADFTAALRHAQFAIGAAPDNARFRAQLGLCQLQLGNHAIAERILKEAVRLDPMDKASWNNLGIARRAAGKRRDAAYAFDRALSLDPAFEHAIRNREQLDADAEEAGVPSKDNSLDQGEEPPLGPTTDLDRLEQLTAANELDQAISLAERLFTESPRDSSLATQLARLHLAAGDAQGGVDTLNIFLAHNASTPEISGTMGSLQMAMGNLALADRYLREAVAGEKAPLSALLDMSELLGKQERFVESTPFLERALLQDDSPTTRALIANNMMATCRYDEAIDLYQRLLTEAPQLLPAVVGSYANALIFSGRFDEAQPLLEEYLKHEPNNPHLRFLQSSILLLHERFADGWDGYAYRNLSDSKHFRTLPFPHWNGETLTGKRIVVLAEQGLGDQVMFASCLPDLLAQGPSRVVVEAISRIAPTLARSFPECEVIGSQQDRGLEWVKALGPMDYYVPAGDLPRHFRRDLQSFPKHAGYLRADELRTEHWRAQIAGRTGRPRIGISWRGGTEHTRTAVRSLDATAFAPLSKACDAEWVCLQYGKVETDVQRCGETGLDLHYWPESISDLDEFSALISSLDLVISVCNTTVHYAGALGTPVWVLAPKIPEWRYGLKSSSMPWYPSSRIFRQQHSGDWNTLLEDVRRALLTWSKA
ncbi:tetratricopeptide repeat protein [Azoarcus sp. L1K30]|uniref:tetratricopeptide repeat protein n=1 Tax=Azoarcus sp. L1K30 TaxID=2820277 RepID=UPI001B83CA7A|nr:tetratricopeptide repeat protein [Azoarcus sp. L1K30]MBR0568018.1 tetratricopeptide repeat protein [Azoarcus sp. L1K30]